MASETHSAPRRRPWLAIVLFTLAALMLCACTAIVWMLATESGTRMLLSLLGRQQGIEATDVRGTLVDRLEVGQLTLHAGENTIRITGARLRWQPWRLREHQLLVEQMAVRTLAIELPPPKDEKPPQLPASLDLPFRLSIGKLEVGSLTLARSGKPLLRAADAVLSLHYDGRRHQLQLQQLRVLPDGAAAVSGRLSGSVSLEAKPPYALSGEWQLSGRHAQGQAEGTLALGGTLENIDARVALALARERARARLDGTVALRPFAEQAFAGAELRASQLDLASLVNGLPHTRIDATVTMAAPGRGRFSLRNTLPGALDRERLPVATASGTVALSADGFALSSLKVNDGEFSGDVARHGSDRWTVGGQLRGLRVSDWRKLDGLPELVLNGHIDADGRPGPKPRGKIAFTLDGTRIGAQRVSGGGKLALDEVSLTVERLALKSGTNRLDADGRLDLAGGDLHFSLQAPALSELGSGYGGALQASGRLYGRFDRPTLEADWRISALRTRQGLAAASAEGKLLASRQLDAPLQLRLNARRIALRGKEVDSVDVQVDGSFAAHRLRLALQSADDRLAIDASGGVDTLDAAAQWRGELSRAQLDGRLALRTEAPAALTLGAQGLAVNELRIASDFGRIVIAQLRQDSQKLSSRGRIDALRLAPLLARWPQSAIADTDLTLTGDWDIVLPVASGAPAPAGSVRLRRMNGDVVLGGDERLPLGLQVLQADAHAVGERIALTLEAQGRQLGKIAFGGSVARRGDTLLPQENAALDGVLEMELPSIAAIAGLLSPAVLASGSLSARLSVTGSVSDPRLDGRVDGRELRVLLADNGLTLQQGRLEALLAGDTLTLRELSFAGGDGQGRVTLSGPLQLAGGHAAGALAWRMVRFVAFDRVDRKLQLSGDGRVKLAEGRVDLSGEVKVDRAFFDVGRTDAPELSDDVQVLGRKKPAQRALAFGLDLAVVLGDQIRLQGRGLDARIAGTLRVVSSPGEALAAKGEVQVVQGTYKAYGRELTIERGVLRFDGPPGNPALDIRAMRRGTEVEAGVSIVGTAQSPRISLVSEPQVPDAEKLSWLVLGQGLSNTSGAQVGMLQEAAGSLLTQGAAAGVQSQIASAVGLDTIAVSRSQDNLQQRIVTLGKRVSSRLYVSYQQGLEVASSIVLLRYTLSPRVTVEAETGTRSVFSLFYNFSFD